MKRLLALLTALAWFAGAAPALASIAIISGSGTNGLQNVTDAAVSASSIATTTTSTDIPVGSFVVAGCGFRNGAATGTGGSDSVGNTYGFVHYDSIEDSGIGIEIIYSYTTHDMPAGTTVTCNWDTTGAQNKFIHLAAFSGLYTTPFDANVNESNTSGNNPNVTSGTLNFAAGGTQALLIGYFAYNGGAPTVTPNGSWIDFGLRNGSVAGNTDLQYLIVSATTPVQFNPALSPNTGGHDTMLSDFKGAASATGHNLMLLGVGN